MGRQTASVPCPITLYISTIICQEMSYACDVQGVNADLITIMAALVKSRICSKAKEHRASTREMGRDGERWGDRAVIATVSCEL